MHINSPNFIKISIINKLYTDLYSHGERSTTTTSTKMTATTTNEVDPALVFLKKKHMI